MAMILFAINFLLHTAASQNSTYTADGRCGSQFDNAPCDPSLSDACCSINGYCGSTLEYCSASHGCQSGCWSGSSSPAPSLTSTSTPTSSSSTPALSVGQKTGIIVGSFLFVAFVLGLLFLWYRQRKKPLPQPPSQAPSQYFINLDPANADAERILRQIADGTRGNGEVRAIMPPPRANDPHSGGTGQVYRLPSYASSDRAPWGAPRITDEP